MVLLEVSLVSQIASERVVTVFLGLEADIGARSGMRQQSPFLIQPPTCGDYSKADIRTGFLHQLSS